MMDQKQAARAVLIEITNILGAFKDDIVIVGGWVPDLTYPEKKHVGSLDVDLAIGPRALGGDAYSSILGRLREKQYTHESSPTRFFRRVPGVEDPIKVDLISGEYVNEEKAQTIQVNELTLNALRGIDLAFEFTEEIKIEGAMPDGTHNIVSAHIVRPEAFILVKAFALAGRAKPKDAYDVAFILANYQPSIVDMARKLKPIIADGLGAEAWQILQEKFQTLNSVGPVGAGEVAEENGQDREQAIQASFQDSQDLFEEVNKIQLG